MIARTDPTVSALLDRVGHPLRKEMDRLRELILATDDRIAEGVKWNTASFRTHEWFATLNGPRQVDRPMVILHAGAKVKGLPIKDRVADPDGLLRWLGADRAQVLFADRADIERKASAFQQLLRAWIEQV